jgi:hypothetical protein
MNRWIPIVGYSIVALALVGCASPTATGPEAAAGSPPARSTPTGLPLTPQTACNLLADQGLAATGGYLPAGGGVYLCSSFKKVLPVGDAVPDTLQFFAQGSAEAVTTLKLELDLRSPGDVQAALRMLLAPVGALTERVLGAQVPEQAQVAIRSGVSGSWPVAGATLKAERITTFTTSFVVTLQ